MIITVVRQFMLLVMQDFISFEGIKIGTKLGSIQLNDWIGVCRICRPFLMGLKVDFLLLSGTVF